MAEAWRLFIAIELPQTTLDAIEAVSEGLKLHLPPRALRWSKTSGIHLTLKFLGDTPLEQIDAVKHGLTQAVEDKQAFALTLSGLGCFPNTRRPRILWLGVEGDTRKLVEVRGRVEKHIAPLGFPTDERRFNPHLTLARVDRRAGRNDISQIGTLVESVDIQNVASWDVYEVSLIRSELQPGGAVYTTLHQAGLQAAND